MRDFIDIVERHKHERGPTIASATTPKGINRKIADRMVDPQGYFHPRRVDETQDGQRALRRLQGLLATVETNVDIIRRAREHAERFPTHDKLSDLIRRSENQLDLVLNRVTGVLDLVDDPVTRQEWRDKFMEAVRGIHRGAVHE